MAILGLAAVHGKDFRIVHVFPPYAEKEKYFIQETKKTNSPEVEINRELFSLYYSIVTSKTSDSDGRLMAGGPGPTYNITIQELFKEASSTSNQGKINLPAVEVTAKAPAKKGTKDFFSKKLLGVPVWFVLLGVVGWSVFFTDRAKIKRKR